MATESELDRCLDVALEVAKTAGKVAYEAVHGEKCVQTKACSVDLVTETDKKVEELILSTLRKHFPHHRFIGEESSEGASKDPLTDLPTWMVDPIDGTANFVHGFPFSAVSIGLLVNRQPVVGVIYNFNLNQLFAAKKGGGATLNGKAIRVSDCSDLSKAMILTELGYPRSEEILGKKIDGIYKLALDPNPVLGVRSIGSAALSMCMVATGAADGYFECGIHCWDVAAGDVILREAGGVTMCPTGEPLDVMRRCVVCASSRDLALNMLLHVHNLEQFYEAD